MFRRLEPSTAPAVAITVDGHSFNVPEGANLAAVLLELGFVPFRTTPVSGGGRIPYCMMGICFDCLATVDGRPNRQTCLETARAGMVVQRQEGAAEAGAQ